MHKSSFRIKYIISASVEMTPSQCHFMIYLNGPVLIHFFKVLVVLASPFVIIYATTITGSTHSCGKTYIDAGCHGQPMKP